MIKDSYQPDPDNRLLTQLLSVDSLYASIHQLPEDQQPEYWMYWHYERIAAFSRWYGKEFKTQEGE